MAKQEMKLTVVTPEMAAKWLDASRRWAALQPKEKNRCLSKIRTDRLVTAIKAGEWEPTNQGICIGKDGIIIDGQHRLSAIVAADTPCEVYVLHRPELTSPQNVPVDIDAYPRRKHWVAGVRREDWEVANMLLEFAIGSWKKKLSYTGSFSRQVMIDLSDYLGTARLTVTRARVLAQVSVRVGAVLGWESQGHEAVSQYAALVNQNHNDMWPIVAYFGSQLSAAALKGLRMDRRDIIVKAWKAFSRPPGQRTTRLRLAAADSRLAHEAALRLIGEAGVSLDSDSD